jgi:hypothetical protein
LDPSCRKPTRAAAVTAGLSDPPPSTLEQAFAPVEALAFVCSRNTPFEFSTSLPSSSTNPEVNLLFYSLTIAVAVA